MKTFEISLAETVHYKLRVQADSETEARDLVMSGEVDFGEPESYGGDTDIYKVQEITETGFPVKI